MHVVGFCHKKIEEIVNLLFGGSGQGLERDWYGSRVVGVLRDGLLVLQVYFGQRLAV